MTLLRPLPWCIVVIAVLLPVKLVSLAGMGGTMSRSMQARAAEHKAASPTAAKGHGAKVEPVPAGPTAAAPAAAALPASPPGPPPEPSIPGSERAVLLELRERRAVLDSREQVLVTKEALLAATERRLQERVEQLTALQSRLEQLDGTRRDYDAANWRGLVKTYEAMRPKDAAIILGEMDGPVLLQVLDRMKESKAAPILAAMPPDRARAATLQLAQLRSRQVAPVTDLPTQGPGLPRG